MQPERSLRALENTRCRAGPPFLKSSSCEYCTLFGRYPALHTQVDDTPRTNHPCPHPLPSHQLRASGKVRRRRKRPARRRN
ncbi:Netrin receptor UNC5C [Frankliniella fusca]|uniref:Netrin receptor UNC5C n=1 Tax=Frankliniella fusca TaxID=407009 RepID=A0AAE1HL75_9NEOP|nr:Netrin receptor UNC5C [Frankliniella fusca]